MTERTAIGVDVGGTGTKAAVVDERGNIRLRIERPTDTTAGTKGVLAVVEELIVRAAEVDVDVSCIGIGAAGFVDARSGAVTFSPNLSYDDPQVAEAVRSRFELPVVVDNDANAAAWGARRFGNARGMDNVAYMTIGTGIGSGFIVDGVLLRGHSGSAAEFGHTVVDMDGPHCPCGLRGCLEQLASGTAIIRMAREAVELDPSSSILTFAGSIDAIDGSHVARAAAELDETARHVLRMAGRALGIGLSNVVNVFDPEIIVLGGGVIAAGEPFLGPARDQLFSMTTAQRRRPIRLDVTSVADEGIIGAAALAFDEASLYGAAGAADRSADGA